MDKVPDYIARLKTVQEARNVMKNAKDKSNDAVYWAAFERLCEIEGLGYDDELEKEFYKVLAAYEALLTEKNGKTTKANRTRQKLARHDLTKCLEDWALSPAPSEGFKLLTSNGRKDLTAEFLVLKYPAKFSEKAVSAAKIRLESLETA